MYHAYHCKHTWALYSEISTCSSEEPYLHVNNVKCTKVKQSCIIYLSEWIEWIHTLPICIYFFLSSPISIPSNYFFTTICCLHLTRATRVSRAVVPCLETWRQNLIGGQCLLPTIPSVWIVVLFVSVLFLSWDVDNIVMCNMTC